MGRICCAYEQWLAAGERACFATMQLTLLLFVVAVVSSGMTSVIFPEETEVGECLPLHRCCHLARVWRERHKRQGGVQLASEILENSRCGFRGRQPLYRCMNNEEFPVECR